MSKSKVYVGDSNIHGKGVFAKEKISKGDIIGRIKSRATRKTEGPYILWLDDGDKRCEVTCDLKYINHSGKPNAVYYNDLTVVALNTIIEGEEITHHYGADWDHIKA